MAQGRAAWLSALPKVVCSITAVQVELQWKISSLPSGAWNLQGWTVMLLLKKNSWCGNSQQYQDLDQRYWKEPFVFSETKGPRKEFCGSGLLRSSAGKWRTGLKPALRQEVIQRAKEDATSAPYTTDENKFSPFLDTCPREIKYIPQERAHDVQSSIIHSGQRVERTKMSTSWWTDK